MPDRRLPWVPYLVLSGVLHFDSADQRRLDDRLAGDTHRIPDDFAVAIVVVSAEVFPTKLRNSGIGFSYNIAAAVFGGLAPLAATALIAATGDNLSITYLMIGSVLVTLLTSVFLLKGYYVKGKRVSD